MWLAAEDPNLATLAVNTAVTTVVGLVVGLVAFPVRWVIQWQSRRRQDDVAAYRQAHRLLRDVQINSLFPEPVEGKGEEREDRAMQAGMLRWNQAKRAWDEALHGISYTRDKRTYERIGDLAELYVRSPVVEYVWREAEDDPGPELLDMAIKTLAWREHHRVRNQRAAGRWPKTRAWLRRRGVWTPIPDRDLERLRARIEGAEAEEEFRRARDLKAYRRWAQFGNEQSSSR